MAGERKQQILETLAKMLEAPKREKITTAALAAKLGVSEAALYRHFANKAQMFEGLISFIEETIFFFFFLKKHPSTFHASSQNLFSFQPENPRPSNHV